jgi:hypothetical protein
MKMDVNVSLPKAALAVLAVVIVLLVALLAWIGGEAHYGNCLEKAAIEYPASSQAGPGEDQARREAVDSCSRWP